MFFRKQFFLIGFSPLFISLNFLNNLLCSLSPSFIDKASVRIFLENITGKEILLKL